MPKRLNTGQDVGEEPRAEGRAGAERSAPPGRGRNGVGVERRSVGTSGDKLLGELEEVQLLLDQGISSEAESRLRSIIERAGYNASILAQARCSLSLALESRGHYRESLETVEMYESSEGREGLDTETMVQVRVRVGLAYNYLGDYPKAIALLNATLREDAESASDVQKGAIYIALARVYRSISEYPIARDYAQKALEYYRNTGDWRGLVEVYVGLALADMGEGRYEESISNGEQAIKLIGEHPASQTLGKIYGNMAGACWFLRRPHDGIRYLQKAVDYYERTEHKVNAALGYNNLGINLTLVGEWDRAQEALKRALEFAFEIDEHGAQVSIILDSLGELRMLRGELEEARNLLERSVRLASTIGNKWYTAQSMRTLGRCLLALDAPDEALDKGREALALAERIGDRQAICESLLLLAEAHVRLGDMETCAANLQEVSDETTDSVADLPIAGAAQRIQGLLALAQNNLPIAAHHFGRSISIFELLDDRYRSALAHYELGRAYASLQPQRAVEPLAHAAQIFRQLGARVDLARTEQALAALERRGRAPQQLKTPTDSPRLLTLRLAEAVASRELLLRELAALIQQEAKARRVLVVERGDEDERHHSVVALGLTNADAERILKALDDAKTDEQTEQLASEHDAAIIPLRVKQAAPATLFVSPRSAILLDGENAFEHLVRIAEMGLDLCDFRERARTGRHGLSPSPHTSQSIMPGFIHSSPAMTRLVDEMHKIRSSDVTVLITGESGTGKELVARAVHALSSRHSKIFVPFNCTAVPKELSESYLFGYRKGAFTGAVADAPGMIRTAAGGTLFLDEIGDLPLDLQPKLLRFLQEGEIQPLGEQRPIEVDVRIIAATNSDLEKMVEEGRFREDLYYRLNVIRLRVPPLRERRSEISTIVNYYVNHYSAKFGRRDIQITPQAVDLLMVSDWPGNVRQLCNELQRVVARAEDGTLITPEHLSPELTRTAAQPMLHAQNVSPLHTFSSAPLPQTLSLPDAIEDLERRMINEALRKTGGNISRAARELGLTRRGLQLKLTRYDIRATA
ncbi:MAG TPA: sigma 54-interacting transcriptional regulator [Pyrinomonadaceae bacterium]|jgi:transcriptional regulator with GAF, ATPase, and Fis domain